MVVIPFTQISFKLVFLHAPSFSVAVPKKNSWRRIYFAFTVAFDPSYIVFLLILRLTIGYVVWLAALV